MEDLNFEDEEYTRGRKSQDPYKEVDNISVDFSLDTEDNLWDDLSFGLNRKGRKKNGRKR